MKREHCTNIYEKCGIARSSRRCFDAKTSFRHEAQGKVKNFKITSNFVWFRHDDVSFGALGVLQTFMSEGAKFSRVRMSSLA